MSELLIILTIIILSLLIFFSLHFRNSTIFVGSYMFWLFFYDYLFINGSYFMPPMLINALRPLNEIITLVYCYKIFENKRRLKNTGKVNINKDTVWLMLIPSLIILIVNDITSSDPGKTIQGLRTYLLPIITPYILYKAGIFNKVKPKAVVNSIIAFSAIAVLFAVVQKMEFTGNLQKLWFYDFFTNADENRVAMNPWSYIREDKLRATSVFVSPLIYSSAISMAFLVCFSLFVSRSKAYSRSLVFIFMLLFLYGLNLSETRIGFFIAIIGSAVILLLKFKPVKLFYLFLIPVVSAFITFYALLHGFTDDPSALGRLAQYSRFFDFFVPTGLGFHNENVLTLFDTFYMSISLVFGILVIFPLYFLYKIILKLYTLYSVKANKGDYLLVAIIAVFMSFIYSFTFQFTAGSYPYRMLFFLVFIVIARYNFKNEEEKTNIDGSLPAIPGFLSDFSVVAGVPAPVEGRR